MHLAGSLPISTHDSPVDSYILATSTSTCIFSSSSSLLLSDSRGYLLLGHRHNGQPFSTQGGTYF